ncbi:MAG: M36 family metallopeptidase [Candidatus Ozemobacteraceae bacterium]
MTFSEDGQQVRLMRGQLSDPLDGELVPACRQFILSHERIFNVPADLDEKSLVVVRNEVIEGVTHLSFGLEFNGTKVHQAIVDIHISSDRRICFVTGSFPTISEVKRGLAITSDAALEIARKEIGVKRSRGEESLDSLLVVHENVLIPAYMVVIPAADPLGDFSVLVHGLTGAILDVENQMKFMGRGSVYTIHPNKSPVTVEPLPNLIDGTLKGKFVEIQNEDFPPATSPTQEFIYPPDNTHFDEVNAYYHINRIHDYFATFGFKKLDRPLKVMVHNETNYDSAFYSPKYDIICFGDGNHCNDFAKEDSVIYHEYAHAVLQNIIVLKYKGESGALNEGQADYFACSLSNDHVLGEYVESKTSPNCIRTLENHAHYPETNSGNVHIACMIWGASLWDLRKSLGAEVTDKLVFNSHYYLKSADAYFFDGYQAILAADRNLNGGANSAVITRVFTDRGVAAGTVHGPDLNARDLAEIRNFLVAHKELN